MPYTRKTKSKNKRKTIKGGVSPSRSSSRSSRSSSRSSSSRSSRSSSSRSSSSRSSSSRSSSRSSSISDSPVNRETWIDLKKILENNNMFINLNLYHGNQFRNLLDDAVQVAKKFTDKEKEQIKKWIKVEKGKSPPVYSNREITIWKEFLNNFSNRIK